MNKPVKVLLAAALLGAGANAMAEHGNYLTVNTGLASSNVDVGKDSSDTAAILGFGGGFRFNEHYGLELSMNAYGETDDDLDAVRDQRSKLNTFTVHGVRYFPMTSDLDVFARVGLDAWRMSVEIENNGQTVDNSKDKDNGYDLTAGVGASYAVAKKVRLYSALDLHRFNGTFRTYDDVNRNYDDRDMTADVATLSVGVQIDM